MAENKTKVTKVSPKAFLDKQSDEGRRADCAKIVQIMKKATGAEPRMWGPAMVGFGEHHYRYESGREGDTFVVGFAPRKTDLTIYLPGAIQKSPALLEKLGKHKTGGGCLYIKRLDDVDLGVLEKLVLASIKHTKSKKT
jgi:hypothetical protein